MCDGCETPEEVHYAVAQWENPAFPAGDGAPQYLTRSFHGPTFNDAMAQAQRFISASLLPSANAVVGYTGSGYVRSV